MFSTTRTYSYTGSFSFNVPAKVSPSRAKAIPAEASSVHSPSISEYVLMRRAQSAAIMERLTVENGEGYFQALDEVVRLATAANATPSDYFLENIRSFGLAMYYERFILGRDQTPQDDWGALPDYKGWKIDENSRDDSSPPRVTLSYFKQGKKKEKKVRFSVAVAPRKLSPGAFEIFQTLCNDRQPEACEYQELAATAEALAL